MAAIRVIIAFEMGKRSCVSVATNPNTKSKAHQSESNRKSKTDGYHFTDTNRANIKSIHQIAEHDRDKPKHHWNRQADQGWTNRVFGHLFFIVFSVLELTVGEDVNKT